MAERRPSRGRGPRVREEEIEKMLALYRDGKSFKAIGREVKRHWQTVRKYVSRALKEGEGRELRREALKEALIAHFRDLVSALQSISARLDMPQRGVSWPPGSHPPPMPQLRFDLLIEALRGSHAKDSPIWRLWNEWKETRQAYDAAVETLRQKVTRSVRGLQKTDPAVSIEEDLEETLFKRADSLGGGSVLYDPSMLRLVSPTNEDIPGELWLAHSTKLATGKDMAEFQRRVAKVMKDMTKWKEIQGLRGLYQQLGDTKKKTEEEAEVLSLRRAFPGRCRLCPV